MFQDFDGVKKLAVAMQKERNHCETFIECLVNEISELRHQIIARDTIVSHTEQVNESNIAKYTK